MERVAPHIAMKIVITTSLIPCRACTLSRDESRIDASRLLVTDERTFPKARFRNPDIRRNFVGYRGGISSSDLRESCADDRDDRGIPRTERFGISAAGSRFAHARRAPQVKPRRADCTARESVWESRSLPALIKATFRNERDLFL